MEKCQTPDTSLQKRELFAVSLRKQKKSKILEHKRSLIAPVFDSGSSEYLGYPDFNQNQELYFKLVTEAAPDLEGKSASNLVKYLLAQMEDPERTEYERLALLTQLRHQSN